VSKRVSPAERLRVQIDEVFVGGHDLARALEEVAQLGAQLLLQCAVEAEVAAFLGRERYARLAGTEDARQGMRNGYCPTTVIISSRRIDHGLDQPFCVEDGVFDALVNTGR